MKMEGSILIVDCHEISNSMYRNAKKIRSSYEERIF